MEGEKPTLAVEGAEGTHWFTRSANTFRPRFSSGTRFSRKSQCICHWPLLAGAGSTALTLVRDGTGQSLWTEDLSTRLKEEGITKGVPFGPSVSPTLCHSKLQSEKTK